ncbi:RNA polymerase sigma factor (sigma-70 family) [Paraburkholderia sp. GAS333]|uniref:RNA polymerase sigma factor n=1 Tax=Paraburkholderia sp. GAS333 TaxID=3156279 RepID=UPI003D1BB64D
MVQTETDARERGDTEAARSRRFQQLALPHLDAAYNLARWLCGNANDADDVVQEAFMRAFRFFDTFRGDTARPWLLAIVRRTWYTEWRRRGPSHDMLEFDDTMDDATFDGWSAGGDDPQTLLIRDEDTKLIHEALAQLPVEYREVLILRELEEMGYREIAVVADLPIGTVMSRLARGRRKLAAVLMEKQGSKPPRTGASGCNTRMPADGTSTQPGRQQGSGSQEAAKRSAARAEHTTPSPDSSASARTDAGNRPTPDGNEGYPPEAHPPETPAAGKFGTATVTPLRASANGRPLNPPGAGAPGSAQETPDGL